MTTAFRSHLCHAILPCIIAGHLAFAARLQAQPPSRDQRIEEMQKQIEAWQKSELTDVTAKVVIYEAFVEGKLEAPKHLARAVHDLYFEPKYEEFRSRTI